MKKTIKIALLIFVAAYSLTFVACYSDDENPSIKSNNVYVNDWILDTMKVYYYWNDRIPTNLNMEQSPSDFFRSLLYKYEQLDGDRFSWLQENYVELIESLSGVSSGDIGFEYMLRGYSNSQNVWGEVLYVKPNTVAELQGLKRGDVFYKINGTEMDRSNYNSLLQNASMTITFADPAVASGTLSFNNERNISLTKAVYAENPIFLDSIYNIHGKKIGYVVYNFFASDDGDRSSKYDIKLNSVFGKFKAAGIDNLIVDLRYNSGGSTTAAQRLASMIVKSLNTNNNFYILNFNSYLEGYWGKERVPFVSQFNSNTINNVGDNLQDVFFITTAWSASASEMIINGLRPFMSACIVGDTTVGKSYASASFYKMNDSRNKWGLQPIIAKYTNGFGAEVPSVGMSPNFYLQEYDFIPKKQLGDVTEELLNKALTEITGQAVTQSARLKSTLESNVISTSINKKSYSNKAILDDEIRLRMQK